MTTFAQTAMGINSNLEQRFSWLAFPGLIRAIVMLQCVVFALIIIKPETASFFEVTPEGIAKGQYWRLIAWIFYPFVAPSNGAFSLINVLFLYIVMRISFMISDSLEHAWGEVRTSFYVYGTLICQTAILYVAAVSFIPTSGMGTELFYLSLFFAFATMFPDIEFALFFVLPVKIWILAIIAAVFLLLPALANPLLLGVYLIAFLPYLIWAIPKMRNWSKHRSQIAARRANFQSKAKGAEAVTLHRCAVCQRTEASDPELEFRVVESGEEYCLDHLDGSDKPPAS